MFVKRYLLLFLLLTSFACFGQKWDQFSFIYSDSKNIFDIDLTSLVNSNGILSAYVRTKSKEVPAKNSVAIDLIKYNCLANQYAIVNSKIFDQNGNYLKTSFTVNESDLKWNNAVPNSTIRIFSEKLCKRSNIVLDNIAAENRWLSLGKNAKNDFTFFVDSKVSPKAVDEISVITKTVYDTDVKIDEKRSYKTILSENIIKCKEATFAASKIEYFNSEEILVSNFDISKEFAVFKSYSANSFMGRISDKYCITSTFNNKPVIMENHSNQFEYEDKCDKLGFKRQSTAFERCVKQLSEVGSK